MLKIILFIIYIATILAVIFWERKNPTEAMLWVFVMVCLPYAGMVLYLVFGSTTAIKLTSVFRRRRLSRRLPAAKEPQDLLTGQIMEFGARVYKYHGYIHAKTMTIDDELCCIGSVNMDMRSLMVDDEICGIFYANDLVQEYIRIFKNDIQNGDPYLYDQFLKRGRKEKIAECVFLPFAPLM